jgi:hypothetical protein
MLHFLLFKEAFIRFRTIGGISTSAYSKMTTPQSSNSGPISSNGFDMGRCSPDSKLSRTSFCSEETNTHDIALCKNQESAKHATKSHPSINTHLRKRKICFAVFVAYSPFSGNGIQHLANSPSFGENETL